MTTQKALSEVNHLIIHHQKIIQGLKDLIVKWGKQRPDSHIPTDMAYTIITFSEENMKVLELIKKQLEPKKCKHPKKMQDIADGQRYCMNCNQDL